MSNSNHFEHEALLWALDGDTVQNLLKLAKTKYNIPRAEALTMIIALANQGLFTFYEDCAESPREKFVDISPSTLSLNYLDSRYYTRMLKTQKTFDRLNEKRTSL